MFTREQAFADPHYRRLLRRRAFWHAITVAAFMYAFGTMGFIYYAIGSDLFIMW